jgi:PAS domain S-box-containing protein
MQDKQKVNILIVDDRAENLLALEAILGDLDENLVMVRSGMEALKCILHQEFALILLDVKMPVMDGFETAVLIRERERSRHTPIIFLTAVSTSETHMFKGYSIGAVDYILKPFVPEILKSKVHVFVDLYRKTEEVKRQAKLLRQTNKELDQINKEILILYKEIETKNAELQIERDFISAVLETAGSLVVILDREGRIVRFNRACEQITGYTIDEVRGKALWDLFLVSDEVKAGKASFERVRAGELRTESEIHWRSKDGSLRMIAWTNTGLVGNDGSVDYIIGTGLDLTERKRAEEERLQFIREQAARVEAESAEQRATFLAEASGVLSSSLEYETTLARVTHLAVQALADWCAIYLFKEDRSLSRIEMAHADPAMADVIRELDCFFPDTDSPDNPLFRALRGGERLLYKDVSGQFLSSMARNEEHLECLRKLNLQSIIIVPIVARERILGAIQLATAKSTGPFGQTELNLATDLARRVALAIDNARLYREAQEANRAKDEFLATVSHELRTPLNAMLGWARMLRAGKLDASTSARALETIERNAKIQAQLIEDILDVSRIITGKLRIELNPIQITSVIEAAIDVVRPVAEAKSVELVSSYDPGTGIVFGDASRLQQVFWNLLANAIKFTPKGGRVDLRMRQLDPQVEITVSDTGKGISTDFLPFVFERFRQADGSITRSHGGLGLGLAIVRHLVEIHGGTVEAESGGEGQGATFRVTLPLGNSRIGSNPEQSSHGEQIFSKTDAPFDSENTPRLDGIRVLVVDDEVDTLDMIVTLIEERGAVAKGVASAAAALEELERRAPDVLVSDIGLPGEDGYALIRKVRLLEAERGGHVPAVALTAYAGEEMSARARLAGFQMHIPKPVEPAELIATVASLAMKEPKTRRHELEEDGRQTAVVKGKPDS